MPDIIEKIMKGLSQWADRNTRWETEALIHSIQCAEKEGDPWDVHEIDVMIKWRAMWKRWSLEGLARFGNGRSKLAGNMFDS